MNDGSNGSKGSKGSEVTTGSTGNSRPALPAGSEVLPAATVVLVRETTGEVLLLLRHARHGFMANVWVFPGGRLDLSDAPDSASGSAPTADGLIDEAELAPFAHAAIRETWEEAGLLLTDPPRVAAEGEARDLRSFAAAIGDDASSRASRFLKIEPFARWITPPSEKRRFDTLFFLGLVPPLEAVPDHGEVIEARWLHPATALNEHRANRLALAPPTLVTLHSILAASYGPSDGYDPRRTDRDIAARWSEAHARRLASWVASTTRPVAPLSPGLALSAGRLLVAQEPWTPWPVPTPLSGLSGIRLVDGHWELEFREA